MIYEDNQPIIRVANNNEASLGDAGRHMETRIFKINELVENETVIMKYIETQRQVADLLTAPARNIQRPTVPWRQMYVACQRRRHRRRRRRRWQRRVQRRRCRRRRSRRRSHTPAAGHGNSPAQLPTRNIQKRIARSIVRWDIDLASACVGWRHAPGARADHTFGWQKS